MTLGSSSWPGDTGGRAVAADHQRTHLSLWSAGGHGQQEDCGPVAWGPAHTDALTLACVLLGKLTQALSLSFVTCTMASATGPTLACCEDLGRAKAVSCCLNWGSDEGEVTGGRAAAAGATCGTRAWCGLWSRAGKGQPWLCWGPGGVLEAFPGQMGEVRTRLPGAVRHLCTPSGSLIPSGPFPNP